MVKFSLRKKLTLLVMLAMLPLLMVSIYLIWSLFDYSSAYNDIVGNMTIANSYNLNFKDELDESLYKLVAQGAPFDRDFDSQDTRNPYVLIGELRDDFSTLEAYTLDENSRTWLRNLMRNIDTLEVRVDDIRNNLAVGDRYNANIEMLDNNIYILTELIQDDIQYYIYYQTKSIEVLQQALSRRMVTFVIIMAVLLGVIILVLVVVESWILRSVSRSVENVSSTTQKIAQGDLSARAEVTSHDELHQLGDNVNDMARNLESMVHQIRDDEKRMRHAELRLLQEQINPHFLYNTLDTIVWLIEGGKEEEAEDMVVSLSNFFRLVLSKGHEYITIAEEEKHIRSYLEIQQVRYRDILTYEIDIDPSIYDYKILKLTLQPIVENALYHGIKEKRAPGTISITGRREEDHLRFVVSDDGAGMDEEALARIRDDISRPCKETSAGFGLANVNERIRMNFGPEYGMEISSHKGSGTTVTLTIPATFGSSEGISQEGEGENEEI